MHEPAFRSRRWNTDPRPRYWWHRLPGMDYVPAVYSDLSDDEWAIIDTWFNETDRSGLIGECVVPMISFLHGLVLGNRIDRIVQLGTCSGYSSLLLGFMLRRMNAARGLFTLDIDPRMCAVTNDWLQRARLEEFVHVAELNSLDPNAPGAAEAYLGAPPQLVIIDSSHEYQKTLDELAIWYDALQVGGLLVLHDVSWFAVDFDVTKAGGVRRALDEWRAAHPGVESFCFNGESRTMDLPRPTYKDACGLALIHKPGIPAQA